eukprot:Hpha_TRINITY_DN29846_c0_g1::TRINITY_DN29846_c0_g1_i1::g.2968::m.2968
MGWALALSLWMPAVGAVLPVVPRSTAVPGSWPKPGSAQCGAKLTTLKTAYCGDVRAVLDVTAADIVGGRVTAQIFWRRRDPTPHLKSVLVLSMGSDPATQGHVTALVESTCGVVSFTPTSGPGQYAVYYMPFVQSNGGANLEFNWLGCNDTSPDESNHCVLGSARGSLQSDICKTATNASRIVTKLENRDEFNSFTVMETMATPEEATAAASALQSHGAPFVGVFPEPRELAVRVFDVTIPSRWVPGMGPHTPGAPSFAGEVTRGEWFVFQLGLWAYTGNVTGLAAVSTPLVSDKGAVIGSSNVTFVNLEGLDLAGKPYSPQYTLPSTAVGSLWVGVAIPSGATVGEVYKGSITLTSTAAGSIAVPVSLTVSSSPAVPFGGAADNTKLSRLEWLYSKRGLEDYVPSPFKPVATDSSDPLSLSSLMAKVGINDYGLPSQINVQGVDLLAESVSFLLFDAQGHGLSVKVERKAHVVSNSESEVTWSATFSSGDVDVTVEGTLDFVGYLSFNVSVTNTHQSNSTVIGDIRLGYGFKQDTLGYIAGMDMQGQRYKDHTWRWTNKTCTNKVWMGRPEAGILLNLKGDGTTWNSPIFGKDYPVIPFVPSSWGGADARGVNNPNGVNITNGSVTAFSGTRELSPGTGVHFLFDLALTPSKPVNLTKHWKTRPIQVGYGTNYMSPQQVAATGATVVTLHQGVPGVVNASLVNPYISYPFGADVVPLLTNYTAQSNALGMATKFYYTVRELSTRATETFALLAQRGEIFVDEDPYTIVQPGYGHKWNNHGGSAYLHQHLVSHYAACWQQSLSNGEWDPSICDYGTSRFFNFYVEGLWWSMTQPPYINGVYYDGINFPRDAMKRIRRTADAAAATRGNAFPALLDVHTGHEPTPPVCSYASHYPFVDYVWNGEGFNFKEGPSYWLIEVSSRVHGLSGDLLGSAQSDAWRGMLFGMTDRNKGWSQQIWKLWDTVRIEETTAVGWWERGTPVVASCSCPNAPDDEHKDVLATTYFVHGSHAVVVLGSWCAQDTSVTLSINWDSLGLAKDNVTVTAPAVQTLQPAQTFTSAEGPFKVAGNKGLFLLLTAA